MKNLKLNHLCKREMEKKEMLNLKGGHCGGGHSYCGCGCAYAGTPGGSSNDANGNANLAGGGIHSSATYSGQQHLQR